MPLILGGGEDSEENTVLACYECNRGRDILWQLLLGEEVPDKYLKGVRDVNASR